MRDGACEDCRDYHPREVGVAPMAYWQGCCVHHGIDVEPGSQRRCFRLRDNDKPQQPQGN